MSDDPAPEAVRMVEVLTGAVRLVPWSKVPDERRWVFLYQGTAVASRDEADEIVPIVEVRRLTLDDRGNLAPPDRATQVRIEELGPGGRPLRWTSMVRRAP